MVPSKVTSTTINSACSTERPVAKGCGSMHSLWVVDIVMENTRVNMYGTCGSLDGA